MIRWIWLGFTATVLFLVLFFYAVSANWLGQLPGFDDLENPDRNLASEIITTDGAILGRYYLENRSNITFANIPKPLHDALLATEDVRFFSHTGVDLRALFRVLKGAVGAGGGGGGSTITQQLAKNLFPRERLSKLGLVLRKFKEWVIAVRLERSYTKEEIMAMYLNIVPFSDNAFGIKSAAYTYFGKPVDSLKAEEAAVLVGMLKAPSTYNPRLRTEASLQRRNVVLNQMFRYDFITRAQRDSLFKLPIRLDFHPNIVAQGSAPYFREYLRLWLKRYFKAHPKPDGSTYDLYRDGLRIYVTLDSRIQKHAEEAQRQHLSEWQKVFFNYWKGRDPWKDFPKEWKAILNADPQVKAMKANGKSEAEIEQTMKKPHKMKVFSWNGPLDTVMSPWDSIRYHRMFLQNGFMAADPTTGFVRAWVGGIDYNYFQFDHVNPNTKRQIGSTFKPFVYTVAIRDKGYSPCFQVPNQPVTFEKDDPRFHLLQDWTPKNSDGKYGGTLSLKKALANSINTVTAYLMHEMTPEAVAELVKKMGVESEIPLQPSICLGTADISLFEMVSAYTTYANRGVHVNPIFVTRIEDKNGNVIEDFVAEQNEVLDEQTWYVMVEILRNVVSGGTATRLHYKFKLPGDFIGKTGTTQNYSDGWFMGAYPELVAGSWVGCDDRYVRFSSMANGQGASTALPIWAYFFQRVISDSLTLREVDPSRKFERPDIPFTIELNCSEYESSRKNANEMGSEYE